LPRREFRLFAQGVTISAGCVSGIRWALLSASGTSVILRFVFDRAVGADPGERFRSIGLFATLVICLPDVSRQFLALAEIRAFSLTRTRFSGKQSGGRDSVRPLEYLVLSGASGKTRGGFRSGRAQRREVD
jgi:hypothetical protein